MANPNQSNAKSLAELRRQREKAKVREKAKEKRDGAKVRQKYKSKKKPKQLLLAIAINIDQGVIGYGEN